MTTRKLYIEAKLIPTGKTLFFGPFNFKRQANETIQTVKDCEAEGTADHLFEIVGIVSATSSSGRRFPSNTLNHIIRTKAGLAYLACPGTEFAITAGCACPVMDNHYGRGCGTDKNGEPIFIFTVGCPIHSL